MSVIILFLTSFVSSIAVGYLSIAFENGVQKIYESEIGKKIGDWIFLIPIIDKIQSSKKNIIKIKLYKKLNLINYILEFLLISIVASIAIWLLFFYISNYIFKIIIALFFGWFLYSYIKGK